MIEEESHTNKKDLVEESVKELQSKINSIECWTQISKSGSILSKTKKDKFVKLGIYEKIEEEFKEFARKKAESLASGVEETECLTHFTQQETNILKSMAQRVLGKAGVGTKETKSPGPVPAPPFQMNNGATNYPKRKKSETASNVDNEGFPVVGSKGHRTSVHDSLRLSINPTGNNPSTYSSIEILDINKEDKIATIKFTGRGHDGATGTIKIDELAGFENF